MKHSFFAMLFCFQLMTAIASPVIQSAGNWNTIGIAGKRGELLWEIQPQLRVLDNRVNQIFIGGALGRNITEHLHFWVGVHAIQQSFAEINQLYEYRIWQDLILRIPKAWGDFFLSVRMDERKLEHFNDIAYRYRQRLMVLKILTSKNALFIRDDFFINLNIIPWIPTNHINQNRIYAGIQVELPQSNYMVRFGYQNQYVFSKPQNNSNHILMFELFYNTATL